MSRFLSGGVFKSSSISSVPTTSSSAQEQTSPSTRRGHGGRPHAAPSSSAPVSANFASEKLTIGAGVAIFHLASERVVVCYHSRDRYWFLPKGRRNASEDTGRAACREGFEESGYKNRLLPLPIPHRQPYPEDVPRPAYPFDTEPLWTQLVPQSRTAQYILFWYAAETLPRDVGLDEPFPENLTIRERIAQDHIAGDTDGVTSVYEPVKIEGTGVDEEELLYESQLLTIPEARKVLKGSIMEDVVRRGWEAVQLRMRLEDENAARRGAEVEEGHGEDVASG